MALLLGDNIPGLVQREDLCTAEKFKENCERKVTLVVLNIENKLLFW